MVNNFGFIWKSIFSTLSKMYFLFLLCIINVLFGGTKRVKIAITKGTVVLWTYLDDSKVLQKSVLSLFMTGPE
jgi:hypothetical protein